MVAVTDAAAPGVAVNPEVSTSTVYRLAGHVASATSAALACSIATPCASSAVGCWVAARAADAAAESMVCWLTVYRYAGDDQQPEYQDHRGQQNDLERGPAALSAIAAAPGAQPPGVARRSCKSSVSRRSSLTEQFQRSGRSAGQRTGAARE